MSDSTLSDDGHPNTDGMVTVCDGQQFLSVEPSKVSTLMRQGFYRPEERGRTIISDGKLTFEVPLSDATNATGGDFGDMLVGERKRSPVPQSLKRAIPATSSSSEAASGFATPASDDASLLIGSLQNAQSEVEKSDAAVQRAIEESTGFARLSLMTRTWLDHRRRAVLNHCRSSGVSVAIHVAIFLFLASLALVQDKEPAGLFISATPTSDEIIDEVVIEPSPLEITDPSESEETEEVAEEEMPEEMAEAPEAPNFLANVSGDAIEAPAAPAPEVKPVVMPPKQSSKVFGTARSATDYVFVIDNSNSMTRGRFETALYELMTAINSLTPKQNFFVIFYSDTAYAMMHPKPVSKLVAATPRNKQIINQWLNTIPLCLRTCGKEAIELGFKLNPDVMYVLGDGAFTDKAGTIFAKIPRTKTIVHCRGMEVDSKKAAGFEALAKAHGGNYKDVGVHPYAAELAKKKPRKRNNIRNGYWGLKLPATAPPKKK